MGGQVLTPGSWSLSWKAPFPWFGGKSRIAHVIWAAFGDVPNYVEPFAGSLAVLLARPTPAKTETVNDRDAFLANFWRATQAEPEAVAEWADWPVSEADLHARHQWLVDQEAFRAQVEADPHFYDVKVAGWWLWGICAWIGPGWCNLKRDKPFRSLPHVGGTGSGIHSVSGRAQIRETMVGLRHRLRHTRVACGDWSRIMGESVTWRQGMTGVLLDPPYCDGNMEYSAGGRGVSAEVRAWAVENGENPLLRIALCGYEGEHEMPATWRKVAWKAAGGFGAQKRDGSNVNGSRERVWLSPACLGEGTQLALF